MPVTGSEARKHLKNITQKYFAGATVDFAEQQGEGQGPVCLPDAREPHTGFVPDTADGG